MGKRLANECMVWIESTTPATYNLIKGQQGATINRNAGSVDLTTKDNSGYGATAPGIRNWSIDLSVIPDLPDATGYTRLETLCNAAVLAPFNIQIRKGGAAGTGTDVIFAGSVYGNLDSTGLDLNSGVGVKVTLQGNGAPTTDVMA
jgi:predicted secreted protein